MENFREINFSGKNSGAEFFAKSPHVQEETGESFRFRFDEANNAGNKNKMLEIKIPANFPVAMTISTMPGSEISVRGHTATNRNDLATRYSQPTNPQQRVETGANAIHGDHDHAADGDYKDLTVCDGQLQREGTELYSVDEDGENYACDDVNCALEDDCFETPPAAKQLKGHEIDAPSAPKVKVEKTGTGTDHVEKIEDGLVEVEKTRTRTIIIMDIDDDSDLELSSDSVSFEGESEGETPSPTPPPSKGHEADVPPFSSADIKKNEASTVTVSGLDDKDSAAKGESNFESSTGDAKAAVNVNDAQSAEIHSDDGKFGGEFGEEKL
jgi:hypothetical protein